MKSIIKLYSEVYDDTNKEFKNCGREKCKELIIACKEYSKEYGLDEIDYGNIETGFLNISNIKLLIGEQERDE